MTESLKPAGWYHAAGDPPGSHRYWNGSQWQGEPRVFGGSAVTQRNPQTVQAAEHLPAPETVQAPGYAKPDTGYGTPDPGYDTAQLQAQVPSQGLYSDSTGQHAEQPAVSYAEQPAVSYAEQPAVSYAEPHAEFHPDAHPEGHTDLGVYPADQAPPAFSMQEIPGQPVTTATGTQRSAGSFLSSLFDLSFTTSITNRAISVIYLLVMVVIGLVTLAAVGTALTNGVAGLISLVFIIPAALFYLVMTRLTLEFFVNQFHQTELMERIADSLADSGSDTEN